MIGAGGRAGQSSSCFALPAPIASPHSILFSIFTSSIPSQHLHIMLTVSQSNALVYCALSAFFLVGLYAGWRTKNKQDFLSGIRTQSGELSLSR